MPAAKKPKPSANMAISHMKMLLAYSRTLLLRVFGKARLRLINAGIALRPGARRVSRREVPLGA
jgi:hypothetical protein